jgi:hypothetical protein
MLAGRLVSEAMLLALWRLVELEVVALGVLEGR